VVAVVGIDQDPARKALPGLGAHRMTLVETGLGACRNRRLELGMMNLEIQALKAL
jgi:hypothetical protein